MSQRAGLAGTGFAARSASLSQWLGYVALLAVATVFRRLPIEWSTRTGAVIGRSIGPRLRQNRHALHNLAVAFPDKSPVEHAAIARAMWANMGRTLAETLVLDRIVADPSRVVVVDNQHWQARMGAPGPSVGCTLHMGNWELTIWPLTLFGRNPAGVYKPLDNPLVDRWLAGTRSTVFPGGLISKGDNDNAKDGQRPARQLIGIVRKGGCIGFVSDHVDRRRGTPIAFMGRKARFTTAPALLARHVGARVWLGRCLRIGPESRFRIEFREIDVPRTDNKSADVEAVTSQMFAVFEGWIRESPEQWMWWNTRWLDIEASPNLAAMMAALSSRLSRAGTNGRRRP